MAEMTSNEINLKKIVAEKAVNDHVEDGMIVGLGTGSTAHYAIQRVGELVRSGFNLTCVATSQVTEDEAIECGIKIVPLNEVDHIDVTIDGADEVDPDLQLIKGLGGALLREKIVAAASVKEIIIVDETKLVKTLGTRCPLPVEVIPYGDRHTQYALKRQGCEPVLRMKDGKPFITDGGNVIYDCTFPDGIMNHFFMESMLDKIPGVAENGLFLNTASVVLVSHPDGTITEMTK